MSLYIYYLVWLRLIAYHVICHTALKPDKVLATRYSFETWQNMVYFFTNKEIWELECWLERMQLLPVVSKAQRNIALDQVC